jgi:spore coat protein U-like protein
MKKFLSLSVSTASGLTLALALALTLTLAMSPNQVKAGSATASTKATASISKMCYISATDINFGNLNLAAPNNINYSNGNVAVQCTKGTAYSIQITFSTPATGSTIYNGNALTGYMTGTTHGGHIPYSIQPHPIDNSTVWGAINGTGNGALQNYTEYGEIQLNSFGVPAYPVPDNYSDTAIATLTY